LSTRAKNGVSMPNYPFQGNSAILKKNVISRPYLTAGLAFSWGKKTKTLGGTNCTCEGFN